MQKIFVEDDGNGLESMICKELNMKTNYYTSRFLPMILCHFKKIKKSEVKVRILISRLAEL